MSLIEVRNLAKQYQCGDETVEALEQGNAIGDGILGVRLAEHGAGDDEDSLPSIWTSRKSSGNHGWNCSR